MVRIDRIVWDLVEDLGGNVQHLAEHGVTMEEVEEVLLVADAISASHSSSQPLVFGWTSTGKHLAVVFEIVETILLAVYPITAFETDPKAETVERIYRKRKLTKAEAERYDAVRAQFAHKPSKAQLIASGDYVGPMSLEEYLAWRSDKSDAPLTKQLKAALKSCGKTTYAIAQESGVSAPILQRFLSGERGITLETAGKLATYLGLGLWPDKGRP